MKNIVILVVLAVGFMFVGCGDQDQDDAALASSANGNGYLSYFEKSEHSDYGSTHDRLLHRVDGRAKSAGFSDFLDILSIIGPALIVPVLGLAAIVLAAWFVYRGFVKPLVEWLREQRQLIDETREDTWNIKKEQGEQRDTLDRLIAGQVVDLLLSGRIDTFNRSFGKKELLLQDVDLSNLDLTGVNALYMVAKGVSVEGSKLEKATMYCSWKNINAKNASFRGSKIMGRFSWCNFEGCDFTGADLTDAYFDSNCRLVGMKLDDVKMNDRRLGDLITEMVRQQAEERKQKN